MAPTVEREVLGGLETPELRETRSPLSTEQGAIGRFKLRLSFGPAVTKHNEHNDNTLQVPTSQEKMSEEKYDFRVVESIAVTTRRGRQVRPPHSADVIYGSELDRLVGHHSFQKTDHDMDNQLDISSSPPYQSETDDVQLLQVPPKSNSKQPLKSTPLAASIIKADEENEIHSSSSETITQHSQSTQSNSISLLQLDTDAYQILNSLRSTSKVHVDLPALSNVANSSAEQPYTARLLTHLYILCYTNKMWNLCDLVVDTWIRAFHEVRKRGEEDLRNQIWRPNKALERRKRELEEHARILRRLNKPVPKGIGFDSNAPKYDLSILDPALTDDVPKFHPDLLHNLYTHTREECGARLLWADAMALGGEKTEKLLEESAKQGHEWPAELLQNIMQTSLRMLRRKLTLKIEESTEGAWCKRYHEHARQGLPCYRELAHRMGEESSEDEDEAA